MTVPGSLFSGLTPERVEAALRRTNDLWPEGGFDAVPGSYEVALKRDAETIRALAAFWRAALTKPPITPDDERELREILEAVYKPEGVELWLAQAERDGWSYEERLSRALALAEGNFA